MMNKKMDEKKLELKKYINMIIKRLTKVKKFLIKRIFNINNFFLSLKTT